MSVRKFNAKLGVVAVATAGLALTAMGTAHADVPNPIGGGEKYFDLSNSGFSATGTISSGALVGVGSDTTQFMMGDLAEAYNSSKSVTAGAAGSITSLSSCAVPASGASTLTSCVSAGQNFPETFPVGGSIVSGTPATGQIAKNAVPLAGSSGAGANALDGTSIADAPQIAFGRGSGTKNTTTLDNLPYAVDQLVTVVSNKVASNAPATITLGELAGIYQGTYTNWAQLGGKNAPIHAYYISDPSSGTYQFFGKQLDSEMGLTNPTASNAPFPSYQQLGTESATTAFVSDVDLNGNVIKEHDPSAIQSDPDAITAMSYSRVVLSAEQNGGSTTDISKAVIKPLGGYVADRAVYNFVRNYSLMSTTSKGQAALQGVPIDWISNIPQSAFASGGAYDTTNATKNPTGETFAQYTTNNIEASLFGASGYVCGSAAKSIIEREGFFQLTSATCGKPVTADPQLDATDMPALSGVDSAATLPAAGTAGTTTLSAKIVSKSVSATGTPSGSVTFSLIPVAKPPVKTVAGGSVVGTLDASGTATVTIPATVPTGDYQVAVAYTGDSKYQGTWTDFHVAGAAQPTPATIHVTGKAVTTTPPPVKTPPNTKLIQAQKHLAKDKKALTKAKKAAKKAHGAKKKQLNKKVAKLKKAVKKDQKAVKKAR
jgi:hypothetical protein